MEGWDIDIEELDFVCQYIFDKLKLMSQKEKFIIGKILFEGCIANLPKDIHIDLTVLERHTNMNKKEILTTLNPLIGLGFNYKIKKEKHGSHHKQDILSLTLFPLNSEIEDENIILILKKMTEASFGFLYCEDCSFNAFLRLDFSFLSMKYTKDEIIRMVE